MNDDAADQGADEAYKDAKKFIVFAWMWRVFTFVLIVLYVTDVIDDKVIFIVLTWMSGGALATTQEGKAEAAKARKASYENP